MLHAPASCGCHITNTQTLANQGPQTKSFCGNLEVGKHKLQSDSPLIGEPAKKNFFYSSFDIQALTMAPRGGGNLISWASLLVPTEHRTDPRWKSSTASVCAGHHPCATWTFPDSLELPAAISHGFWLWQKQHCLPGIRWKMSFYENSKVNIFQKSKPSICAGVVIDKLSEGLQIPRALSKVDIFSL